MKKIVFLLLPVMLLSCSKGRFKIDTNKVDLNVKIERFDRDLMSMDTVNIDQSIAQMNEKYGEFFPVFSTNVIMLGVPESGDVFKEQLKAFLRDSTMREIYDECQRVFADVSDIQTEVTDAFKYIKYYFPDKKIPRVAMHISGFNQSVVVTEELLSISIDNYLGADYIYYKDVAYSYELQNMTRSKVAPDILLGYIMSEFPVESGKTLLAQLLSRGKIYYLQSVIMPKRTEADIMGYTEEQYDWCKKNEKNMWDYLVSERQLYETSQLVSAKYINPAPFTVNFTQESPGQAAIWIGWQIIKSYMDNNPSVTLPELIKNLDYQKILEQSKYKPS
jgi:gliding motility-associated lipoprotein GldB